jgi:hypothetical protein
VLLGILLGVILVLSLGCLGRFIDWRLVRYGKRFKANTYASMIAAALGDRVGIFLATLVSVSLFVGLVGLLVRCQASDHPKSSFLPLYWSNLGICYLHNVFELILALLDNSITTKDSRD